MSKWHDCSVVALYQLFVIFANVFVVKLSGALLLRDQTYVFLLIEPT